MLSELVKQQEKEIKTSVLKLLRYRVKVVTVYLWKHIKSWQFLYLFLFGLGELLSIFLNDPSNIASYYSPLFLLIVSFIIKMLLLLKRINCRIFWRMQLDFASPYVLTVINMVLLLQSCFSMQSFTLFEQIIPNMTSYTVVNSLQLLIGTLICSLVMNKRTTTKMQYYMILVNIVVQAGSNLYLTITTIQTINSFIDQLRGDNEELVMKVINQQLTTQDYQIYYNYYSEAISALESSKDFSLACIASIISVLVILMDFIGRPLEKLQHQEEIYEQFIRNYNLPLEVNRNTRNSFLIMPQQKSVAIHQENNPTLEDDLKKKQLLSQKKKQLVNLNQKQLLSLNQKQLLSLNQKQLVNLKKEQLVNLKKEQLVNESKIMGDNKNKYLELKPIIDGTTIRKHIRNTL